MNISFIIPAKNEEKRIVDCIQSIMGLDKENIQIEIVVIDNGSVDNTVLISQNLGASVYIQTHVTIGQMRNFGATKAKGEILVFVDADVILSKTYVYSALAYISDTSVGIITGRINTPSQSTWVQKAWDLNRQKAKPIMFIDWASSMNMIIRKEVFFKVAGFTKELITCEDVDISRKIVNAGYKILYIESVSVIHMGDAKNIREFYLKERWRGKSQSILKPNINDIKSFIISYQFIIYTCFLLLFAAAILTLNIVFIFISLILILTLPSLRAFTIAAKTRKLSLIFQLLVVWTVYYFARSLSLIEGYFSK